MNYVIIGNSAAAIGATEAIRKVDNSGEITIISDEKYHTYSRPLISYLLLGKTTEERMKYRSDSFYKDNNVKLLTSTKAVSIDKENKWLVTSGGDKIPYDKLLVSTGSSPFVPPMEGLENVKNKFTFSNLDDAKAIEGAVKKGSKVVHPKFGEGTVVSKLGSEVTIAFNQKGVKKINLQYTTIKVEEY